MRIGGLRPEFRFRCSPSSTRAPQTRTRPRKMRSSPSEAEWFEVSYILKTYFVVIQDSDQLCLDYKARCDKTLCLPCGKALHSNRCKIVNLYSA